MRTSAPDCEAPYRIVRGQADFDALDLDRARDAIHVDFQLGRRRACLSTDLSGRFECIYGGAEAESLLYTAWAILQDSADLVDYAVCWVARRGDWNERMQREITGTGNRTNIVLDDNCRHAAGTDHAFVPDLGASGGRIHICTNVQRPDGSPTAPVPLWRRLVDIWTSPYPTYVPATYLNARSQYRNRLCAAVYLATILAHELVHKVQVPDHADTSDPTDPCPASFLIDSLYRWLLLDRWSDALSSSCCGVFGTTSLRPDPARIATQALAPLSNCVNPTTITYTIAPA